MLHVLSGIVLTFACSSLMAATCNFHGEHKVFMLDAPEQACENMQFDGVSRINFDITRPEQEVMPRGTTYAIKLSLHFESNVSDREVLHPRLMPQHLTVPGCSVTQVFISDDYSFVTVHAGLNEWGGARRFGDVRVAYQYQGDIEHPGELDAFVMDFLGKANPRSAARKAPAVQGHRTRLLTMNSEVR